MGSVGLLRYHSHLPGKAGAVVNVRLITRRSRHACVTHEALIDWDCFGSNNDLLLLSNQADGMALETFQALPNALQNALEATGCFVALCPAVHAGCARAG